MNIDKFRTIIEEREHIEVISHGEWQYGIEQCWKQMVAVLSEDIPSTIVFLENECSAEEYSWISEIIDELAMQQGGKDLLTCYKKLMTKLTKLLLLLSLSLLLQCNQTFL